VTPALEYVRRVVVVAFLAQIARWAAPDGATAPYVRLVTGLLVLLALLSPLASLPHQAGAWQAALEDELLARDRREGLDQPQARTDELTLDIFRDNVEKVLASEINALEEVREAGLSAQVSCRVVAGGPEGEVSLARVDVTLSGHRQKSDERRIVPIVIGVTEGPVGGAPAEQMNSDRAHQAVVEHVASTYSVPRDKIQVYRAGG